MSLTPQEIRQILEVLEASEWDEAVVTVGDVSIAVSRNGGAAPTIQPTPASSPVVAVAAPSPAPVHAPPVLDPVAPVPAGTDEGEVAGVPVISPTVGIFWRSPQPGAPPFVEVGSTVALGDMLCIVEVMKLMNNVAAEVAGIVVAIHVENAGAVEFGQPLMTIRPENG